jgi:hypothetical protein
MSHSLARRRAMEAVANAPAGYVITVGEPTRNLEQNARLWRVLGEIAAQVDWYGKRLTPDDWKNVFTASLKKLEVVPNLDGSGFVALGQSSSRMSTREFSELLELAQAFGASKGVVFNEPATTA